MGLKYEKKYLHICLMVDSLHHDRQAQTTTLFRINFFNKYPMYVWLTLIATGLLEFILGLLKQHVVTIIYFCVLAYLLYLVYCVG